MSSIDPVIGVVTRTSEDEAVPAYGADMSTIIIFGPMPGCDETLFKLDEPVKGYSNDQAFLKKMGIASDLVPDAVRGINDQLADAQFAAQIIVSRTKTGEGANVAERQRDTLRAVVGDITLGTGIYAGLTCPEDLQATPRIWLVPGQTAAMANGVDQITRGTQGIGYVPLQQYPLTFAGGGDDVISAEGYVVADATGKLGQAVITSFGMFYDEEPTVTVEAPADGGTRGTYTASIDQLANPVNAALSGVLGQYLAHAVVESAGTSQADDELWRETVNERRLIGLVGGCKVTDPVTGNTIVRPLAPRMAGAMVRRDKETGGCFHSACNQPIRGILGPARKIRFNISSGGNEGQDLLGANLGILVRGDVGNDFAIASGGFTILATDNLGDSDLWRFYNQQRGRDYINLTLTRTLRYFLGKFNITALTINSVIGTMKNLLRDLQANENILGWQVAFTGALNSADEIRKGNITIQFKAEEPTPLRRITTIGSRFRPAVDALVSQLEAQLNIAA